MAVSPDSVSLVRHQLIEAGGRLAYDFGFNRVAGQVLACLYLIDGEASLDEVERELHLSKAAVSLACAQLERLGLIRRIRHPGDRKRYFQTAEDIGSAFRNGLLTFARSKLVALETCLQQADVGLDRHRKDAGAQFVGRRVARLRDLARKTDRLLANPLVRLFAKLG